MRFPRALVRDLCDLIFPPACHLCGAPARPGQLACAAHRLPRAPGGPRCGRCAGRLPPALPDGNDCAECRRRPLRLARVVALGDYRDPPVLREWILAFKHGGRPALAAPLGRLLARRLAAADGLDGEPVLVPVPLHPLRRLERGFDQALLLASEVSRRLDVPCRRALWRVRSTPPQGEPHAGGRASNVRGAFRLHPEERRHVEGRRVWLVDDVLTSGATAEACARVLRRGGARRVSALVLGRAARSTIAAGGAMLDTAAP